MVVRPPEVEMEVTRLCAGKGRMAMASIAAIAAALVAVSARADHARPAPSSVSRADGGDMGFSLQADVDCAPLQRPGRVQCVVHLRPVGGTLHFSDALVLAAPPFAPPVRDRVVVRDGQRGDDEAAIPVVLTANGDGAGDLYVMARATVCSERGCRPVQSEATGRVVVGTAPQSR
jgi:hypothetical protein